MRAVRGLIVFITIVFTFVYVDKGLARWYAGVERTIYAYGVTALISAPQNPLLLMNRGASGESNWVSSYYTDANGEDWLQAGWKLYWYYDPFIPQQYVEWCVDGRPGGCTDYFMSPIYASQNWGTTVDYWVERVSDTRWCAITGMIQRYCIDNIHPTPVSVYAKSEVHETQANSLDTTFDQVRFKDPSNNWWYFFDSHETWVNNYPYNIDIISTSHFRTYREITNPVYLPIIMK